MICPNCSTQALVGPNYGKARATAVMTCRNCKTHFDAYELFGLGAADSLRKAA
jgi:hypothetical protein